MTLPEMKDFVRNHFEEFVNRKNLDIADVNYSGLDHGADVPPDPVPREQAIRGRSYQKFPDIHVEILDLSPKTTK